VNKKVAIVQNKINLGGRLDVIVHIVKYLNDLDIIPHILTFSMNAITKEDIYKYYNLKIDYDLIEIKERIKLPHELNILYFNFILKRFEKRYDFFISSNNTSYLMPCIPVLSYVHFPRKYRLLSKYVSIHDRNKVKKGWLQGKSGPYLKLTQQLYKFNKNINSKNLIICNSEFSKQCFREVYHHYRDDISVIHPPVFIKLNKEYSIKEDSVVSIGRFSNTKGQLEQIKIAERLQNVNFHIVGFTNKKENYYLKCYNYVKDNKVKNVFFHINASYEDKRDILKRAKIFLHTTEDEPFGITIVEGIMNGCLPIVSDSGGQKEIVFLDRLRYTRIEEIREIIKEIIDNKINYEFNIKILQNHIKKYDRKSFLNKLDKIYGKFISEYVR